MILSRNEKTFSFCTVCANREDTLSKVYYKNLDLLKEYYLNNRNIEFILVNYNSKGNIDNLFFSTLREYSDIGLLKYYKVIDDIPFHMALSKNLSHSLASNNFIINLDCDVFMTNVEILEDAYKILSDDFLVFIGEPIRYNNKDIDTGVVGFLGCKKDVFMNVGGYDINMCNHAWEDINLATKILDLSIRLGFRDEVGLIKRHLCHEKHPQNLANNSLSSCINTFFPKMKFSLEKYENGKMSKFEFCE